MENKYFPKLNRQKIAIWGMVILFGVVLISSFSENGAFSNQYSPASTSFITASIFLSTYLLIVWGMRFMGLNPSKFEMIFLPLIIIVMLFIALSITDNFVNSDDNQKDPTVTQSSQPSQTSITDSRTDLTSVVQNPNQNTNVNSRSEVDNGLSDLFTYILLGVIVFLLIVVAIYLYRWKDDDGGEFQIAKPIAYSTPLGENQLSIIESYIRSSTEIENLKGRAPKWFTPTFFSNHVSEEPGPPLSSYFHRLTELYELARFSIKDMSLEDVVEARDLDKEIRFTIKQLILQHEMELEEKHVT